VRPGLILVWACAVLAGVEPDPILVIHSYHQPFPWTAALQQGIVARIQDDGRWPVQVEWMDAKLLGDDAAIRLFAEVLPRKHPGRRWAAVLTTDDPAAVFARTHQAGLLAGAPLVSCGLNFRDPAWDRPDRRWTGLVESWDLAGTLRLAVGLGRPPARILLVNEQRSLTGAANQARWAAEAPAILAGIPVDPIAPAQPAVLARRLAAAGTGAAVVIIGASRSEDGMPIDPHALALAVGAPGQPPVFSPWEMWSGHGVVGGSYLDAVAHGRRAAELAVRVAGGADPGAIPIENDTGHVPVVDWAAALAHGLDPARAPAGTRFLNRPEEPAGGGMLVVWLAVCALASGLVAAGAVTVAGHWRRLARRVAAREAEVRLLIDSSHDLVTLMRADSTIIEISPVAATMLGRDPAALRGSDRIALVHPEDRDQVAMAHAAARSDLSRAVLCTYRLCHADGGWRWVEAAVRAVEGPDGLRLVSQARDVGDRVAAEQDAMRREQELETAVIERTAELDRRNQVLQREIQARSQSEQRLRILQAAIEQGDTSIALLDLQGLITYANPPFMAVLGGGEGDVVGQPIWSWMENATPEVMEQLEWALLGSGRWRGEGMWRRHDGQRFWAWLSVCPIADGAGRVQCILVNLLDISERKAAEEERTRLGAAIEQIAETIVITNAKGIIQYVNPAFERTTGYSRAEAVGRNVNVMKSGHHDERFYRDLWDTITAGRVWSGRFMNRRKDGTIYPEEGTISPVRDAQGRIVKFIAVKRDISEMVRLEQQLRHAQKLESIGQLAAGIAHEINTPIQFIGDNTTFLDEGFQSIVQLIATLRQVADAAAAGPVPPELLVEAAEVAAAADVDYLLDEVPRAITQSREGLQRVGEIVRAMKEFSHPEAQDPVPADLNHAIRNTVTISRNAWKYVADLELELDPALPPVPVLLGDFNQAVLNLIVNAAQAIGARVRGDGGKGRITVRTAVTGDQAVVTVVDDGGGIPEAIRHRIFEPFFTTKPVGQGTGQGLSIARAAVVGKMKGSMDFTSREGVGTTFTIRLPLERAAV
jgi:PAS domain S-box-containing protein